MQPWERDPGAVYLPLKSPCEFRGKPLHVSPSLLSPTPPPPPLAEIYKEQKNPTREGGGLIYAEAEIERRT